MFTLNTNVNLSAAEVESLLAAAWDNTPGKVRGKWLVVGDEWEAVYQTKLEALRASWDERFWTRVEEAPDGYLWEIGTAWFSYPYADLTCER